MSDAAKLTPIERSSREHAVRALLRHAKELAVAYQNLTGKALGVTGEIAEYEAAEKLDLVLADATMPLFDAFRELGENRRETFQIKGRAVSAQDRYRGRVPSIECEGQFDAVLLVLLDRTTFDAIEIWRAERVDVMARLSAPGSKSRNERSSMGISQFKSTHGARRLWPSID